MANLSAPARRPDSALGRPHLLVVSDDLGLRQFLAEGLLHAGFWTSAIASAIQTLEVFRLRSFDAVLVDASLAGLGGLELVRRLRGPSSGTPDARPRTDVPLLLIATGPDQIDLATARAAGADALLTPPLALEDVAALVWDTVARWRADHPDRPTADAAAQGSGAGH